MTYVSMRKFPEARIEFTSALYEKEYNAILYGHTVGGYTLAPYAYECIAREADEETDEVLIEKAYHLIQILKRRQNPISKSESTHKIMGRSLKRV